MAKKKIVKKQTKSSKKPAKKKGMQPAPAITRRLVIPDPDDLNIPPDDFRDYTTLLMGAKGIGKTTASSGFPGNLTFMWEPRRKNVKLRMIGANEGIIVRPAQAIMDGEEDPWELFKEYHAEAVTRSDVKMITWDTVDLAYQACFESVCARLGVCHPKEIKDDYGNSWNIIKNEFTALIDTIRASDKVGLMFISHVKERDQEFAEGMSSMNILGPSAPPACIQILKSACDFWLYYGWDDGNRKVWCRDEDRMVDVAAGTGFIKNGKATTSFVIPNSLTDAGKVFYDTVNAEFKGDTAKARPTVKKKVRRKTA